MPRTGKHAKKTTIQFKLYYVIIAAVLLALLLVFLYVRSLMVKYERSTPENYATWLVTEASENSPLGQYLEEKNFSDNRFSSGAKRKEAFYEALKTASLTSELVTSNHDSSRPVINIKNNDQNFITICLEELSSTPKLGGIMTLSKWDIVYAIIRNGSDSSLNLSENNTINASITIPDGFKLLVDGETISIAPKEEIELEEFKPSSKTVPVPKGLIYELTDFYYEPAITALNNGDENVDFEKNADGTYIVKPDFVASPQAKEFLLSVCDPLAIGENWSKLMTADLDGDLHGFYTAVNGCRMLYGTDPYNQALAWCTNVDITFVSEHTLLGFSNEKVDNFVKYNDSLYSCDVYFEKNMRVNGNKTDVFNNRLFFGAAWGTWYMLDMLAL